MRLTETDGPTSHVPAIGWRRRLVERLLWSAAMLVPKSSRVVLIFGMTGSEDGALAIQEELVRRGYQPRRLITDDNDGYRSETIRYARKSSLKAVWWFARSGVVFCSHALYGGHAQLPGQLMVVYWHGEFGKLVGLFDHDRTIATNLAPVCSTFGRAYRAAEFGLHPERVQVLGAPRNDRLLRASRTEVRERLGWDPKAQVWLWLPTYRSAVRGGRRDDVMQSFAGMPLDDGSLGSLGDRLAASGITLILKPHPLGEQQLVTGHGNLVVLRQDELDASGSSLYELLAAADGLITDASSVWVDFLLTERPMVFLFPDIDDYRENRGLSLEPFEEWAPGPIVTDVSGLMQALTTFIEDQDWYRKERIEMKRCLHNYTDPGSTDRLLDALGL